jgi:hypothetical protein
MLTRQRLPEPKSALKDARPELHADLSAGISAPDGRYTVGHAIEDWLRDGLDGRADRTIVLNRGALKPFIDQIGKKPLRELTAQDVRRMLTDIAAARSSRTVVVAHNAIERVAIALVAGPVCGDSDLVVSDLVHEAMLVSGEASGRRSAIGPAHAAASLYDGRGQLCAAIRRFPECNGDDEYEVDCWA